MKHLLNLAIMSCLLIFFVSSCKKDVASSSSTSTSTTGPPPGPESFTALLNGQPYTATSTQNYLNIYQGDHHSQTSISGNTSTNSIVLVLTEMDNVDCLIQPQTYSHKNATADNAFLIFKTYTPGGGSVSDHGMLTVEIKVTSCNESTKTVSGTFSGKLVNYTEPYDTINITNGVFKDLVYLCKGK